MRHPVAIFATLLTLAFLPSSDAAAQQATADGGTRLLRFPDIHGDQVAFVYAGDIWIANTSGGLARRLTSHEGMEVFPKFSPDGTQIAFSGEYSGTRQVHVISVDGGTPRQLTFYNDVGPMPPRGGFDYRILGWTPDGKNVVFRANRLPWGIRLGRPYQVPVDGGLETPLAIPEIGGGDLSPDGSRMAFTPWEREFRTWKRYRGGRAQDVWIYDLSANTAQQITNEPGTDNQPVWVGDRIYFTSDRDWKLNLYEYDPATGDTRKVTDHEEFDVLWPSGGPGGVVYENGGWIYRYDPTTGASSRLEIRVAGDLPFTRPTVRNVSGNIESAEISPSGARALFSARGEIWTVPAENGRTRNLTRTQGVREMSPAWSPDGRWIAYLGDATGEYELYVRSRDGSGDERRVTTGGDVWKFAPVWSPDSRKLAFGDKDQRLRYVDVATGGVVDVDRSSTNDITTCTWSPDSRWIAYTKTGDTRMQEIWVYSLDSGEARLLTDPMVTSYAPAFDPEGRYLYFLSNRDMNLTFSGWEFAYVYTGPTRLYVGTLHPDIERPFQPKSDDEEPDGKAEEAGDGNGSKAPDAKQDAKERTDPIRFQVDGFESRVVAVPGPSGNYSGAEATAEGPVYLYSSEGVSGPPDLKRYLLEDEKEETILEGVNSFNVSRDGKKVLYRARSDWGIAKLAPDQKVGEDRLDLADMEVLIDPVAEWAQIYRDAWRIMRDWFYDPGMHGLDWEALGERYGQLVPYVAHRGDLDYILGELGGELNAGHLYVNWGDIPVIERHDGGLLGAELEADGSGRYRIAKIFPGENWHPDFRSPLTEPGADVAVGDFLLAIDGHELSTTENPYRWLQNKAGKPVMLTVNDRPGLEGAREVHVRPVASETNLRYLDWVQDRRRRVAEASGGRIGYIHLPNTAVEGNRELFKNFYPRTDFDALILDDRYNGGGFIPDRMIELLDRPVLSYWARRGITPMRTPGFAHEGPKAMLINGLAASGGDALPYYFRERGLGPLIGTRTWGGLIGLSGNPDLVDGGSVSVPRFRFYDTAGRWAVEGEGVSPDIEVVDRPDEVAAGRDPSLEKAVEILLERLKAEPPTRVEQPAPFVDPHGAGGRN
jgi:tricorn protease